MYPNCHYTNFFPYILIEHQVTYFCYEAHVSEVLNFYRLNKTSYAAFRN